MMVVWFGCLSLMAWIDIWKRKVPIVLLIFLGVTGVIGIVVNLITAIQPVAALKGVMISLLIGVLLLLFSRLTKGALGEGDGWFFLVTGLYLTWEQNLVLLCYSLLLSSMYGMGVFLWGIWKKRDVRRKRLPFLPFVWMTALLLQGVIQ